jgi:hypothetical protein
LKAAGGAAIARHAGDDQMFARTGHSDV